MLFRQVKTNSMYLRKQTNEDTKIINKIKNEYGTKHNHNLLERHCSTLQSTWRKSRNAQDSTSRYLPNRNFFILALKICKLGQICRCCGSEFQVEGIAYDIDR